MVLSLKNMDVYSRYTLLRLLEHMGIDGEFSAGVKALSTLLGLSIQTTQQSIKSLIEAQWISCIARNCSGGRGRPINVYWASDKLKDEDAVGSLRKRINHESIVVDVLARRVAEELKAPARYLLAILIAHADQSGCVSDVGRAKLYQLTGLNKRWLDSQVKLLKSHGYLDLVIDGFSTSSIAGKVNSIYIINLHKASGNSKRYAHINVYMSDQLFPVGSSLKFVKSNYKHGPGYFNTEHFPSLSKYGLDNRAILSFQFKLNQFACQRLVKKEDVTIEDVHQSFTLPFNISLETDEKETAEYYKAVADAVAALSKMIERKIKKVPWIEYGNIKSCLVLPSIKALGDQLSVVRVYPHEAVLKGSAYVDKGQVKELTVDEDKKLIGELF